MKRLLIALLLVVIAALAVTPVFASETCMHEMNHQPTIASLSAHVDHAYEMKHLANRGVYEDLKATLNQAQVFETGGQTGKALAQVEVFILKVQAQGAVIDLACREHLLMHAQDVVAP